MDSKPPLPVADSTPFKHRIFNDYSSKLNFTVSDTSVELRKEMIGKFISITWQSFKTRFLPVQEGRESPDFTGLFDPIGRLIIRTEADIYDPLVSDYCSPDSSLLYI